MLQADEAPVEAAFLQRTLAWCSRRGIRIRRLLTDNAMVYRAGVFSAVCRRWTVRQRFIRPYPPQTNGKAERFIQALLREWAFACPTGARRDGPPPSPHISASTTTDVHTRAPALALDAFPRGCPR